MEPLRAWVVAVVLLTGCATPRSQGPTGPPLSAPRGPGMTTQGWIGISHLDTRDVDTNSGQGRVAEVDETDMPAIGGVFQRPFGGGPLTFGLEGGVSFGWQGNVDAIAIGGGGAVIAADTDMLLGDFFGGPYVFLPLGDKLRLYCAGGVLLEWGAFDFEWDDPTIGHVHLDQDGFGSGLYARTGFEFDVGRGTWIGLGARLVDSSIDPGGEIDNVDLRQIQYLFTVTRSL